MLWFRISMYEIHYLTSLVSQPTRELPWPVATFWSSDFDIYEPEIELRLVPDELSDWNEVRCVSHLLFVWNRARRYSSITPLLYSNLHVSASVALFPAWSTNVMSSMQRAEGQGGKGADVCWWRCWWGNEIPSWGVETYWVVNRPRYQSAEEEGWTHGLWSLLHPTHCLQLNN